MKKILFCTIIGGLMMVACAKEKFVANPVFTTPTGETRAANDIFTVGEVDGFNGITFYVDDDGDLWTMHSKGYFVCITDYTWENDLRPEYCAPYNEFPAPASAVLLDNNRNLYIITPKNYLIRFNAGGYVWRNAIDLSPLFPAGTAFLGLTTNPTNGHIFVSTAQGIAGGRLETQDIYRIAPNGNVTKVVSGIEAPIQAVNVPIHAYGSERNPDLFVYQNALYKASGATMWGMDCNGDIFRANASTGAVEYFTPRVPVQCFTAASAKANPYALSGNRIVELRPAAATDRVVGSLPATISQFKPISLLTNADATVFYLVVDQQDSYEGNSYTVRRVYKLSL